MNSSTRAALILAAATAIAPLQGRADIRVRSPQEAEADRRAFAAFQGQVQELAAIEQRQASPGTHASAGTGSCKLFQPDAHRVPAQECMNCHGMHRTHPVEIDYEAARLKPGSGLRPSQEVIARGVFLPDAQVRCVSCHEARSRWASHLAIPPGALVRPAVVLGKPETFEQPIKYVAPQVLAQGTAVSPTPLCKACHTIGD